MLPIIALFTTSLLKLAVFLGHISITTGAVLPGSTIRQITNTGCCFAKNCEAWSLQNDGRTVHSTCWDKIDQRHWYEVHSALDLAQCVTNQFGILAPDSP